MTEQEFSKKIRKVHESRVHKISGSYTIKDMFKYYRQHRHRDSKYVVSDLEYFKIVRALNNKFRDLLLQGEEVIFPERMGKLELRKKSANCWIENGKMNTNRPIDWNATIKLWYEDKECHKNKTVVRRESKEIFKIYYNKKYANYNNKSFFTFHTNTQLKKMLKENIINEGLDTVHLFNRSYEKYS